MSGPKGIGDHCRTPRLAAGAQGTGGARVPRPTSPSRSPGRHPAHAPHITGNGLACRGGHRPALHPRTVALLLAFAAVSPQHRTMVQTGRRRCGRGVEDFQSPAAALDDAQTRQPELEVDLVGSGRQDQAIHARPAWVADVGHWFPGTSYGRRGRWLTCRQPDSFGRRTAGTQAPRRSYSRSGRLAARYLWPGLLTTTVAVRATPAPWYPSPLIV
jgi:hypothetical protein